MGLDRITILLADPAEQWLEAVASFGVEEPLAVIRVRIGPAGGALVEAHRLKAYDAVHLASAAAIHGRLAEPIRFASWDLGLEKAARREGLDSLRSIKGVGE